MSLQKMKIVIFCFGLSNFNIIPLLQKMLNFVGQHHTGGISYTYTSLLAIVYVLCFAFRNIDMATSTT